MQRHHELIMDCGASWRGLARDGPRNLGAPSRTGQRSVITATVAFGWACWVVTNHEENCPRSLPDDLRLLLDPRGGAPVGQASPRRARTSRASPARDRLCLAAGGPRRCPFVWHAWTFGTM